MSVPIYVERYNRHPFSERPTRFHLDRQTFEIITIESNWRDPRAEFFQVVAGDGKRYLLRHVHHEVEDEWTLQSGFDGDELLKRPNIELIVVGDETIEKAEVCIRSCMTCDQEHADIPFNVIVAEFMGRIDNHDFILSSLPRCPACNSMICEETLVRPR